MRFISVCLRGEVRRPPTKARAASWSVRNRSS